MPRQDVPYGGAICRLKERIAEIWDKLGEKLHSINGVEGDAAGDVKIVSGDAAITISDDQVNHQITIGLDQAELPSAAVTSVNGETGAVVLDGDDIELINGAGVTAANAIITNGQRLATLQGDLNTEISDRQTADAALQGNINTVQASIPTAAATAVANDPTVAQLATDVPNKLDKIVSGSTLKAYTHTSATQGETAISSGTDANSIGLRDADGRMHGADPASGATDKTLVTANWVSQTGESKPNNIMHTIGNDRFRGYFQQTGFSNSATSSQGVNLQVVRPSDDLTSTIGSIAITRNVANNIETTRQLMFSLYKDNQNWIRLSLEWVNTSDQGRIVLYKMVNGVTSAATVATL